MQPQSSAWRLLLFSGMTGDKETPPLPAFMNRKMKSGCALLWKLIHFNFMTTQRTEILLLLQEERKATEKNKKKKMMMRRKQKLAEEN